MTECTTGAAGRADDGTETETVGSKPNYSNGLPEMQTPLVPRWVLRAPAELAGGALSVLLEPVGDGRRTDHRFNQPAQLAAAGRR